MCRGKPRATSLLPRLWRHAKRNYKMLKVGLRARCVRLISLCFGWFILALGACGAFSCFLTQAAIGQNTAPSNSISVVPVEKWDFYKRAAEGDNVPLTFCAKVIDQDGNPVPGVKVVLRVQQTKFSPQYFVVPKYVRCTYTTGDDGRLTLDNMTGRLIDIETITKDGYELEANARRSFGTVSGSTDNPVLLKMWKASIRENLISDQKSFHIKTDGTPCVIDLTRGTISENGTGDLKIWIKYPDHPIWGPTNDWLSQIAVINGGLLEETQSDTSMYSAPDNGYLPSFQYNQQIRGEQRGSTGEKRFYLKLKDGKEYGRMKIELYAPYNDRISGLIRIDYAINPKGSRILR